MENNKQFAKPGVIYPGCGNSQIVKAIYECDDKNIFELHINIEKLKDDYAAVLRNLTNSAPNENERIRNKLN